MKKKNIQIIPDSEENRYVWDDTYGMREAPEREIFESSTPISTGAGGEGKRLRYYVLIHMQKRRDISKKDARTLVENLQAVAKKMDVIIEHVHFRKSFAVCSVLIPMDLAAGEFVEAGIASCKKELPYLCNSYFITNVKKPGEKEIEDFIEHD